MNRAAAAALAALGVGATERAAACPCQGASGPAAAVTTQADIAGGSLSESTTVVHGAFTRDGNYSDLAAFDHEWSLEFTLRAGVRPVPLLELGVQGGVGKQVASTLGTEDSHTGITDTVLHARFEPLDEPMPFEKTLLPWPSVALVGSLRVPTASSLGGTFGGTTGGASASPSSGGLGAYELALAAAFVRSIDAHFQLSLVLEGAYRFPDTIAGHDRKLPPRVLAQAAARYAATESTGVGVTTDLGAEGNLSLDGRRRPDTDQRIWGVGAFGYLGASAEGLRSGAMLRWVPPVDGIGKNAARATTFAVSLADAF